MKKVREETKRMREAAEDKTPKMSARDPRTRPVRADPKGGPSYRWEDGDGQPEKLPDGQKNKWGGNLRNEGRKIYFYRDKDGFRDENGKITGYGTTRTTVVPHNGAFYAVPTIFNGEDIMDEKRDSGGKIIRTAADKRDFDEMDRRALQRLKETGEYWASFPTREEAIDFARGSGKYANDGPHATQAAAMQKNWNKFILRNLDKMSNEFQTEKYKKIQKDWQSGENVFGDGEKYLRQDARGGDAGEAEGTDVPTGEAPVEEGGPRIVINPSTFRNEKDALCVAFNEGFRIIMEMMDFEPMAEPTEAQRKFFSDTAYNNDEVQLRRTILARICTFDTSVKDPTDEQLQEASEFLHGVLKSGAPQNEWEQSAVQRILTVIDQIQGQPGGASEPEEGAEDEEDEGTQGDNEGGDTQGSVDVAQESVVEIEEEAVNKDSAEEPRTAEDDPEERRKEEQEKEQKEEATDAQPDDGTMFSPNSPENNPGVSPVASAVPTAATAAPTTAPTVQTWTNNMGTTKMNSAQFREATKGMTAQQVNEFKKSMLGDKSDDKKESTRTSIDIFGNVKDANGKVIKTNEERIRDSGRKQHIAANGDVVDPFGKTLMSNKDRIRSGRTFFG